MKLLIVSLLFKWYCAQLKLRAPAASMAAGACKFVVLQLRQFNLQLLNGGKMCQKIVTSLQHTR